MSYDLVFLALSLFTWGIGESMFLFFQPLYLQQLGASPVLIGTILGGWAIAMAAAHLPAGYLADRIGRRPLIWASWFTGLLATLVMAFAKTLPVFVAGLLFYGLTSFVMAPMNSYITTARGKWSVGRALTLVYACFSLGAIAGPWLGGRIGDQVGLHTIYFISAGLFAVSNITILFLHPQPVERRHSESTAHILPINGNYLRYLGIISLAMFVTYIPQPLSTNYLQNQHGLSFSQIGQLGSISSLGVVVLNLGLGQLNARLGFLLGQAAVAAFALLLWRGNSLPSFALGYFLLGGYKTARALATAQTQGLVKSSHLGLAFGLAEFVNASATVLAPPVAGFLYQQNPDAMYYSSVALILFSLLIGYRFAPQSKDSIPKPVSLTELVD
ncbi:MAG: MFS transporter [Omnitrophica WOR_2 bacterium]